MYQNYPKIRVYSFNLSNIKLNKENQINLTVFKGFIYEENILKK